MSGEKKKRTTPDLAVVRRVWGAECEREARKLIDACHQAFTDARGYSTPQGVEVALTPEDSTAAPWYLRRVMVPGKHWALELDAPGSLCATGAPASESGTPTPHTAATDGGRTRANDQHDQSSVLWRRRSEHSVTAHGGSRRHRPR